MGSAAGVIGSHLIGLHSNDPGACIDSIVRVMLAGKPDDNGHRLPVATSTGNRLTQRVRSRREHVVGTVTSAIERTNRSLHQ